MYLESEADIPKSQTHFWRQQGSKVIGKIWEEQVLLRYWLWILDTSEDNQESSKISLPFMASSGHFKSHEQFYLAHENILF